MSRKPQTEEERQFARHVGERLDDAIDAQDLTRDEAAERLGIHRSMLYRYLAGKSIPGSRVLQRACEELGVSVDYRGVTVDADYYKGDKPEEKPRVVPIQMQLFSRESFSSEFASVDIRKKKHAAEETLELRVTLKLRGTRPNRMR
jgi:transcriptional regulator with XRE-family HTH domain